MQLVPYEEVHTVGFPVQGLTKDLLCSNAEQICWKIVLQIRAGDVASFVLTIQALLTLAELCIVHHRARSGIIVALKALRLLSRNQDYVSLSVPEEPDLLENVQRGREEAEALGLAKFTCIFKLYEELYRSKMQVESLDHSLKNESQFQYTLEGLFIRVNIIDVLTETKQRDNQDLLEEVLDLKRHLIISALSKTPTLERPASVGNSSTDALLRLMWTSMQCCCRIMQQPNLPNSSAILNDTALSNLPMHLVYDLIAPKVLGSLKQRYKSIYEYKFAEKNKAISEDPNEHCQLLLSIMAELSAPPTTTNPSVNLKTTAETRLKEHFGGKDRIAVLAPTPTGLTDYREKLTSLYSAKLLHQDLSLVDENEELDIGFAGDQLLLTPPSTPLYRPDAVYWGQNALSLHHLRVSGIDNTQQDVSELNLDYSALKQLEDLLTDRTTEYEVDYAVWLRHLEPITPAFYETWRLSRLTQGLRSDASFSNKNELLLLSIDVTDLHGNAACLLFMTKRASNSTSKQMGNVFLEGYFLPNRAELRKLAVDLRKILLHIADPKPSGEEGPPVGSQGRATIADIGPTQTKAAPIAKKKPPQDTTTSAIEPSKTYMGFWIDIPPLVKFAYHAYSGCRTAPMISAYSALRATFLE
ncbi:unnamed protein product [Schistocephalus solidus]|uniref:Ras-GEF domain-containing protein n=1 Tax=Schistocephalus solidus TaxID=70667 RepID=A0A183TFN5_SCHSO|nr:unnamed protein product [Schistocephalus solidus]